jgi:carboxymethylenebutenolidase
MGETIQFQRPDGKPCPGYLAKPKADATAPGFVVIQEWWGLNNQIKKTADRLAEAGYRALVPDLFRGKITKTASEANHLMAGLNFLDAAEQDIRGAVQYLKQSSKKVAVQDINIPMILHFAKHDDWCTSAKIDELEAALKRSRSKYELYRYEAHHGFMNETRPEVYEPGSATTAWERTLKFLKNALA